MKNHRYSNGALIGALVALVGLSTAWSVGRGRVAVEPAPMERILETEASAAGESAAWDLPVTSNEAVDRWVTFLSGRNADKTQLWLERKGKYGPMIRAELRSRGMPEDLVYLAIIESGLSPKAYSKAAASGMWQFIAETGKRYGLEVSAEVDERRDPIKSTGAALDYLEDLYTRFGSWYLAAAAYNSGENRVERILRERAGGAKGDDELFWKIAPHLPRETRDYVPLMLAAGYVDKDPQKYGLPELNYQDPLAFDVVWVPGSTELGMIAKAAGVPLEDVADLNTHLTQGRTPTNRGWSVRIPAGTRVAFEKDFPAMYREARLAAAEEKKAPVVAAVSGRTHRVKRGETLSHIAKRYDVSVAALRSVNGNVDPRRIRVGQTVRLPSGAAAASAATATKYHRVARGDNLTVIARRYGISISQIRSWNRISGSRIMPGQRLRVST